MSFPFDSETGLVVVPVRLLGPNSEIVLRFALDTGATSSMMGWEAAVLLGYDPAAARERIRITSVSGLEFVPRIAIERVEAVGQQRTAFPMLCHTLPPTATVDGLLGVDFFRDRRLVINFRSNTVSVD